MSIVAIVHPLSSSSQLLTTHYLIDSFSSELRKFSYMAVAIVVTAIIAVVIVTTVITIIATTVIAIVGFIVTTVDAIVKGTSTEFAAKSMGSSWTFTVIIVIAVMASIHSIEVINAKVKNSSSSIVLRENVTVTSRFMTVIDVESIIALKSERELPITVVTIKVAAATTTTTAVS